MDSMTDHLSPKVEAVEQFPNSLPAPLENSNLVSQVSEDYDDIDWEIETIAQRRSNSDSGTKTEGSQGCH
jgi:hypothetical protein